MVVVIVEIKATQLQPADFGIFYDSNASLSSSFLSNSNTCSPCTNGKITTLQNNASGRKDITRQEVTSRADPGKDLGRSDLGSRMIC